MKLGFNIISLRESWRGSPRFERDKLAMPRFRVAGCGVTIFLTIIELLQETALKLVTYIAPI